MKLIIFGSSGSIGRHLVSQAKARGHEVTGFQRNPPTSDDNAPHRMVQGDVLDAAAAAAAVAGQDAVLVVVGNGRKGGLRAPGTAHIIAGMQAHGVRRLICQSTLGAGDSAGNLDMFWKYLMFGLLLRPAYADHQEQERLVRASGLDWTIVRPAAFTDGPAGDYVHGFPADETGLTLKIARIDVARFMLDQLKTDAYLRQTPGLSYRRVRRVAPTAVPMAQGR